MRYMDVANRLVASPALPIDKKTAFDAVTSEEPPFDLKDLLRRYGSSPPNSEVSAPPSSSVPARNPSEHSAFPRKDG